MFYYNPFLPSGRALKPQLTIVLPSNRRRSSEFTIVVDATLVACSDPSFFASDFTLPYWLSPSEVGQLGMQFSSFNTLSETVVYIDAPNCDISNPDYYLGSVPPPGQVSLLSSPDGCNGSVTTNFGNAVK